MSIDLRTGGGLLTLAIADNGQGIPRGAQDKPAALGLKGLRQSARTVNGRLRIASRAGTGTSVVLKVPLEAGNAPPAGRSLPA